MASLVGLEEMGFGQVVGFAEGGDLGFVAVGESLRLVL